MIVLTLIFAIFYTVIFGEADFNFIMNEVEKGIVSIGVKVTLSFIRSYFLMLTLGLKFGYEVVDYLIFILFCFSFRGLVGEI